MNKKIIVAVSTVAVICVVAAAAYLVLSDKDKGNAEEPVALEVTNEELAAFGVTLIEEDMKIVLHDVATLEGEPFDSDDFPKKYVLLNFWASYSDADNRSLQKLHEERSGETFTVLTISVDEDQEALESYLEKNGYDFPVLINAKNNLHEDDIFKLIPAAFLLDPNGYIIAKFFSDDGIEWNSKQAYRILDHLIITDEELTAFGVTLIEEDMKIKLHDVATLEGEPFDSDDFPKKYVLLSFWASWCPYCKADNPSLQKLHEERSGETFTVLAISIDTKQEELESYLEQNGYDFPVVINAENNLRGDGIFDLIPTYFLLTPEGDVVAKFFSDSFEWDSKQADLILDRLIRLNKA